MAHLAEHRGDEKQRINNKPNENMAQTLAQDVEKQGANLPNAYYNGMEL